MSLRLRPYKVEDRESILSWCHDEKEFYQWTAGVLGKYPITANQFDFVEKLMPFIAFDDSGVVGFFYFQESGKVFGRIALRFRYY